LRYFIWLLLLFALPSTAQTQQGTITDAITKKPLYPVTVVNTTTQEVAYTNEDGWYSIIAKQGEVVAFSYIGYKSIEKVKPPSVIMATINIQMERLEYQLQEFKFRYGNLTKYQIDSTERAKIYKVPLSRTPPNPFASPASAFAELFSKKARRVYEFQQNFRAGEIEKFVDTRYTPELVNQLTGFTGDTIGHFMYAYPMEYDFARLATDLEIKMWIRYNYREWIAKKKTEAQNSDTTQTIQPGK
jgi:hypothetical protein